MSINGFTEAQKCRIEEAREKEKIVLELLAGKKLRKVLESTGKEKFYTPNTWTRLKKKYQKEGFWGLIDQRGRVGGYKVTDEVIDYISREKEISPQLKCKEVTERIKVRTGRLISKSWLNKILKRLNLNNPWSRPRKEQSYDPQKGVPVDHAGCWFLKGADCHMDGTSAVTDVVRKKREEYILQYGKKESFRTLFSWPLTIQRKNETLLYLPVFGMKRPKDLERYHKPGLGLISGIGKRYRYSTLDKHQRELEKLNIAEELSKSLARCYVEAFFIKIELEDKSCFYIDGHFKTVWSSKNIPRAFRTTLNKTEKSLEQVVLNSSQGYPLILLTCPGDRHLIKEMFNLIDAFEGACGKRIVKISVFDREGVSIKVFQEFDYRKKYFITLLKENQHKGLQSFTIKEGFVPYKIDKKTGKIKSIVADGEILLKDREEKLEYKVRVALLIKDPQGLKKLIPVITNITVKEEPNIKKIVDKYFNRWPDQENIIKDMIYGVGLDTNHGYKKKEVENRTILRKKAELEKNIRGLESKLKPIRQDINTREKEIEVIQEVYQSRIKQLNKDKNELHYKILLCKQEERKNYLQHLKGIEDKMLELTSGNEKQLFLLRTKLENKRRFEMGLISQKEGKEEELSSLDMEQKLYEVVTEKDDTMTNFKLLLYNLSRYAREQWFSPTYEKATFLMMRDKFYSQDGYVKIGKRKIRVTLNPYDDDELQKDVEQACRKFNSADVQTLFGRQLEIHVEPQQKSGGNPDVTENLGF